MPAKRNPSNPSHIRGWHRNTFYLPHADRDRRLDILPAPRWAEPLRGSRQAAGKADFPPEGGKAQPEPPWIGGPGVNHTME